MHLWINYSHILNEWLKILNFWNGFTSFWNGFTFTNPSHNLSDSFNFYQISPLTQPHLQFHLLDFRALRCSTFQEILRSGYKLKRGNQHSAITKHSTDACWTGNRFVMRKGREIVGRMMERKELKGYRRTRLVAFPIYHVANRRG